MKAKKKIYINILLCFSVILMAIPLMSSLVFADESNKINSDDLAVAEKIFNTNPGVLDWNMDSPLSIEDMRWSVIDNEFCLTEIDLSGTEIQGEIDLSKCRNLTNYSFSNTNIKNIVLPECMNSVPKSAFEGCGNLEYLNIPLGVEMIENSAFRNCEKLKTVVLNNDLVISSYAFSGCISLECVAYAINIDEIGENAFENCSNLVFYDYNETYPYIEDYAQSMNFAYSTNMDSNVTGYISIMTSAKKDASKGIPYKAGTAYLYDERDVMLKKQKLDEEGKFFFDKLSIGFKYRIVIDGEFAVKRNIYFVASRNENYVSTTEKSIPVVACDFNKDDTVTSVDAETIYNKIGSRNEEEIALYDLNGDSAVTIADAGIVYATIGFSYND